VKPEVMRRWSAHIIVKNGAAISVEEEPRVGGVTCRIENGRYMVGHLDCGEVIDRADNVYSAIEKAEAWRTVHAVMDT